MIVLYVVLAAFLVVWCWSMWIALTRGDDIIARFGKGIMGRLGKH